MESAKEYVMLDDGCGFGDKIACCPECHEPIILPLKRKIFSSTIIYQCFKCGTMIVI